MAKTISFGHFFTLCRLFLGINGRFCRLLQIQPAFSHSYFLFALFLFLDAYASQGSTLSLTESLSYFRYIKYIRYLKYLIYLRYLRYLNYLKCIKYIRYLICLKYLKYLKYLNKSQLFKNNRYPTYLRYLIPFLY